MRAAWQRQAKRIDALSLRERVFLFLSASAVLIALADTLVLSPAVAEQQRLSARIQKQAAELKALREQLAGASRPGAAETPQDRQRSAVALARQTQEALDADLQRRLNAGDERTDLPGLLARVLRRHERLALVKLATVAEPPAVRGGQATARLHWQGVELGVAGGYLDLMNYLAELETALPGLRWGELRIAGGSAPTLMNVQLFLAGEAP